MGYSPWGRKELDETKQLILSLFFHFEELLMGFSSPSHLGC